MAEQDFNRPRRDLVGLLGAAFALSASGAPAAPAKRKARPYEPVGPLAPPPPMVGTVGYVDVPGARLFYRDSGGKGVPFILAHPITGSAMIWGYQQAAFATAGYRVIAWSRRGHAGSETLDAGIRGDPVEDLDRLADAFGLTGFHALGVAAGGGEMLDYAVARPARLRSLVVAGSIGNIADPAYRARSAALRPEGFSAMPAEFRELGPCYRAADPDGVARWRDLEKQARTAPLPPMRAAKTRWEDVAALPMPVLWLTGDADLYAPPPMLDEFRRRLPASEVAVIDGAGHAAYWEQPAAFNAAVIDFLRRRTG